MRLTIEDLGYLSESVPTDQTTITTDPASAAANAIEQKTGSKALAYAAAGVTGYLLRGYAGAAIGLGLYHFIGGKKK